MDDKYQKWYNLKHRLELSTELAEGLLAEFHELMPQEYKDKLKQTCINFINAELVRNFEKDFLT